MKSAGEALLPAIFWFLGARPFKRALEALPTKEDLQAWSREPEGLRKRK